jgi:hypothetical protein
MNMWLVLLALVGPQTMLTTPLPGMWGAGAAYLWPGPTAIADYPAGGSAIDVVSPDKAIVLSLRDSTLRIQLTREPRRFVGGPIAIDGPAEVMWAPDSRAFALTWTDGGWVGTWHVVVYRLSGDTVEEVDTAKQAFRDFSGRKVVRDRQCDVEAPNMGAVAWLKGSSRLLVLAEAPPHSSCCDMGKLQGYAINIVTGGIVSRYDETDLKRVYGTQLGTRFR